MLDFIIGAAVAVGIIVIIENIRYLRNRRRPYIYALIEPANFANGGLGYQYIIYNENGGPILTSRMYPTWLEANSARAEFLRSKRVSASRVLPEKGYIGAVAEHNDRVAWRKEMGLA